MSDKRLNAGPAPKSSAHPPLLGGAIAGFGLSRGGHFYPHRLFEATSAPIVDNFLRQRLLIRGNLLEQRLDRLGVAWIAFEGLDR